MKDLVSAFPPSGLRKFYDNDALMGAIKNLKLPREIIDIFCEKVVGGREHGHLVRLLERPGVEKEFALAFLENYRTDLFNKEEPVYRAIGGTLNGQTPDTTMFWTFAPHLFAELRKRKIEDKEAMRKVLLWAKDGVSSSHKDWEFVHLKGLEFLNRYPQKSYALHQDPNHLSHQFTKQEAERIVEEVLLAANR